MVRTTTLSKQVLPSTVLSKIDHDPAKNKLSKPYRQMLENWETDYSERASERWKETHQNFVKELLFQQDMYDSYRDMKKKRNRIREMHDELAVDMGEVDISNLGTVQRLENLGDMTATKIYRPIEYYIDTDPGVPVKRTITYYGVFDDAENGAVSRNSRPLNKNIYLDYKPTDALQKRYRSNIQPTLEDFNNGRFRPKPGDDVYEVVEETLMGDTDPFGMVQKRRTIRDGLRSRQQELLDLLINEGVGYHMPSGGRVNALDLAEANGLSREAIRNRVNKRTGQQQISYVYEGFQNDEKIQNPRNYGSFLSRGHNFELSPYENTLFSGSNLVGGVGGKYLTASGYETKPINTSLLAGTTLESCRPRKKGRYSSRSTEYDHSYVPWPTYSYLDDYYNYSRETQRSDRPYDTYNVNNIYKRYQDSHTKPFGLDYNDLQVEQSNGFQTVKVDLGKRKFRDSSGVDYPRIVLPKKTFMDDINIRLPRIEPTDYVRRTRSSGWRSYSTDLKRYRRRSAEDDSRAQMNAPGMAGYMAGAIVNDALDRLFGHGGCTGHYHDDNHKTRYREPLSLKAVTDSSYASRPKTDWKLDMEKEDRERERKRKEREEERKRNLAKMDAEWEAEKRDRDSRLKDRDADREREKKKREMEWQLQQDEWDRQKREREREREKLKQERERLDEEARLKAKQKFDPR